METEIKVGNQTPFPIPRDERIENVMGYKTSDITVRNNILSICQHEHMRNHEYVYGDANNLCPDCFEAIKGPLSRICADFTDGEEIYNQIIAETKATRRPF